MSISKLNKFAWVFFALALTTTTVFAQGWRNGNQMNRTQNVTCLEQISGITENQKTKILELENKHQQEMEQLRTQRRSTIDWTEKENLRTEMDKKVTSHRNNVKALLTEEQQKQYDQLHTFANPNYAQGQRQFAGRGRGNAQSFNRSRRNCPGANNQNFQRGRGNAGNVAPCGRSFNQNGRNRWQNFRAAGRCYGKGRFANRGYGRGYQLQTDSLNNVQKNN